VKLLYIRLAKSILVLALVISLMGVLAPAAPTKAATSPLDFRNAMRKLWEDHITYTRLYIVEAAAGLPGKDATAQRLLANQGDIGNAIKPFYGDDARAKLTALLKDHILGAVDLIAAAKAGDTTAVKTASDKWYANANDIAAFLSSANPTNWPLATTQQEMKMHLDLTVTEALDQLQGNYAASVADYDKVHEEILGMADILSAGIVAQLPDMFSAPPSDTEMSLRVGMRKLWEDHITYTRLYIVEAGADLPGKDATAQRLLANQDDIGNAIKPFYGDAAGAKLTSLLKDHILGAVDLIAAAKAGDNAKVQAASDKWYANANDIATFLSSANPTNWPLATTQNEMKMHLDLTTTEAVDQLKGNYAASVADYDKVHEEILGMADILSTGLVAQFPQMFGGGAGTVGMPRTGIAQSQYSLWPTWLVLVSIGGIAVIGGLLLLRRDARLRKSLAIHAGAAEPQGVSQTNRR
jgi:hypothetical protein